jgi:hypothetical protein
MLARPAHYAVLGAMLALCVGGYTFWTRGPNTVAFGAYNPVIDPEHFVAYVDNKYFTLRPGTRFTYEDRMSTLRIEMTVSRETRKLMGITTTGVRVMEWRNGLLKEDTTDWYAQDKSGNVWYFGESVTNYPNGKEVNQKGSWLSGIDGAKPGIIMPADPQPRAVYRQEYLPGRAEDIGTVVAIDKKVTVPYGTFDECVQIEDASLLSPTIEYKYYCPAIGFLAFEEVIDGGPEAELVGISRQ